ncbi:MAG: hypothetical protein AAB558_04980 [Patescibacteria group bacterium]
MATKKMTTRRVAATPKRSAKKGVARVSTTRASTKRSASPKKKTTHVSRVHHHWKKSHYQNVLHFSLAPKYEPIKGFSFLEGTLALMIAVFSFTILLGNKTLETTQVMDYNAETITVHHERHTDLYDFFRTNQTVEVFTRG